MTVIPRALGQRVLAMRRWQFLLAPASHLRVAQQYLSSFRLLKTVIIRNDNLCYREGQLEEIDPSSCSAADVLSKRHILLVAK